jgi:hypothetical protein
MSDEVDPDRRDDERFERAVFWRELVIVAIIAGVIVLRALYG